jgi:hypothetical protein
VPRRDYEDDENPDALFELDDDELMRECRRYERRRREWSDSLGPGPERRRAADPYRPGWHRRIPPEVGDYGPVEYGWFGDHEVAQTVRPNPRYV